MAPILAEVAKLIINPVPNGYYPVYVDTPRKHAGFCAWHSVRTAQGVTVQFAFFFNLDGEPGCDPGSTSNTYSPGVAALANVSGDELSEALADPHLNAWYDSGGAENADKCAWTFGRPLPTLSNGSQWKVQGNYSKAAAAAGSGTTAAAASTAARPSPRAGRRRRALWLAAVSSRAPKSAVGRPGPPR
jgi:hypothetical protein